MRKTYNEVKQNKKQELGIKKDEKSEVEKSIKAK